ncbi:MAG: hypothetical protein IPH58_15630 [Sphingobacteriales bacterium]|jgi:hypothetical protein|nr:hypothetical protein [Sphingobacteriales bacterium]
MTPLQRKIFEALLSGGKISGNPKYGYRLKDSKANPLLKFSHRTFFQIKHFLRMEKSQFVLNKKEVRSLSKKYWLKQRYLQNLKKAE